MGLGVSDVQWGMVATLLVLGVGWWVIFGWGVNKMFNHLFAPWKKKKKPAR